MSSKELATLFDDHMVPFRNFLWHSIVLSIRVARVKNRFENQLKRSGTKKLIVSEPRKLQIKRSFSPNDAAKCVCLFSVANFWHFLEMFHLMIMGNRERTLFAWKKPLFDAQSCTSLENFCQINNYQKLGKVLLIRIRYLISNQIAWSWLHWYQYLW